MNRRQFFKWTGLGTLGALFAGSGWLALSEKGNPYYSGPVSNHFNGVTFFNPEGKQPNSLVDVLKWRFTTDREPWPETYQSPHDGEKPRERVEGSEVVVTMVGHATLLIQTQGLNMLTDPVWSERASPFQFAGPKRANPPGVRFEDLPPVDYVLLSHNHYDHLDLLTLDQLVRNHDPLIITPLGNDAIIKSDVPNARFHVGDWGDVAELEKDVMVHFEPVHHWSARGLRDRRMALWAGFLIETPDHTIYHVGDTGYHDGINYRLLREKHGDIDIAILPFGAYEPRWFMSGQHQNPDEAVQGHMALNARHTIGHHWGTFQLTNEGIEKPLEELAEAKRKYGVAEDAFVPLRPGERWQV